MCLYNNIFPTHFKYYLKIKSAANECRLIKLFNIFPRALKFDLCAGFLWRFPAAVFMSRVCVAYSTQSAWFHLTHTRVTRRFCASLVPAGWSFSLDIMRMLHYRDSNKPIFCSTSDIVLGGKVPSNSAFRVRQSKLFTWSERIAPVTDRPAGTTTSKGYPLI
jgi:hypothetical protein